MKDTLITWAVGLGILGLVVIAVSIIVSLWWLIFPLIVLYIVVVLLIFIIGPKH